jgi:uncharacterized protein (DUF1697 family)
MDRYAAFLRGVNLGPTRKAPSARLRESFEAMGFTDVATFRNSGNVIFSVADGGGEDALRAKVEEGLERALGFEVVVFLRSEKQMHAIAGHEPFDPEAISRSNGKLQVSLLQKAPSGAARKKVLAMATDEDPLAFKGSELYWLPSGGLLESELDLNVIAKLVGQTTRRTMGTMEQIASKFFGSSP